MRFARETKISMQINYDGLVNKYLLSHKVDGKIVRIIWMGVMMQLITVMCIFVIT